MPSYTLNWGGGRRRGGLKGRETCDVADKTSRELGTHYTRETIKCSDGSSKGNSIERGDSSINEFLVSKYQFKRATKILSVFRSTEDQNFVLHSNN
jgi:hypothetical protein